jgi:predicted RNA-binding Zn-ribbon protein involved in translation (DUF1610 family)
MDDELRITNALRRRGTTMLCPACAFPLRGPVGSYRLAPDVEKAAAPGIRVVVYGCGNCGYVRLHSANVLDQV